MRRNQEVQAAFDFGARGDRKPLDNWIRVARNSGRTERETMAETAANTAKPRKSSGKKADTNGTALTAGETNGSPAISSNTAEAKSRFNAALEEARAGAVALFQRAYAADNACEHGRTRRHHVIRSGPNERASVWVKCPLAVSRSSPSPAKGVRPSAPAGFAPW